ncbi:DUF6332 family protein [Yinghuangia aomiensis]
MATRSGAERDRLTAEIAVAIVSAAILAAASGLALPV